MRFSLGEIENESALPFTVSETSQSVPLPWAVTRGHGGGSGVFHVTWISTGTLPRTPFWPPAICYSMSLLLLKPNSDAVHKFWMNLQNVNSKINEHGLTLSMGSLCLCAQRIRPMTHSNHFHCIITNLWSRQVQCNWTMHHHKRPPRSQCLHFSSSFYVRLRGYV